MQLATVGKLSRIRKGWLRGVLLSRPEDSGKSLPIWTVAEVPKACCEANLTTLTALLLADSHLLSLCNNPRAQTNEFCFVFLEGKLPLSRAAAYKQLSLIWSIRSKKKKKKVNLSFFLVFLTVRHPKQSSRGQLSVLIICLSRYC